GIAVGNLLPVGPLPLAEGVAIHPRGAQPEQEQAGQNPFHYSILAGERLPTGACRAKVGTFLARRPLSGTGGSATMGGELSVKPVRAITWTDVGGREASLIQRCAARDEDACAELVAE